MKRKTALLLAGGAAAALLLATPAAADRDREGRVPPRLERKIDDAARVLGEFLSKRDSEVPADLIDDAACVAVLPDVAKGAVGIGGRYGKGLVSCRLSNGDWSPPAFIEIGGISFGLQIGGQATDLLLVVRNRKGADYLLRDKFTLGGDVSVAAGPVGRTASAATDIAMQAGILSYSRSRGLFAGIALDGAVVKQDKSDNRRFYGRSVTPREVLMPDGAPLATPPALRTFVAALDRYTPERRADRN